MEAQCPKCQGKIFVGSAPSPEEIRCGECGCTYLRGEETVTFVPVGAEHEVTYVPSGPRAQASGLLAFGDYELIEEVARGGMGVVYKARQKSLNRTVALKLIRAGEFADAEEIARFHAEAEAAAQLDHPGIVPVYDVGEQDGQHFLSMAFVDGGSLTEQLADGPLPPKRAADVIKSTADAVQYAHERGVIHRDLKPRNILLDAGGQPRVSDFGLAKNLRADSDLTATGKTLGTPAYMPPEQAQAAEVGTLADIYSLGATLYCLLTGRPPFQAATSHETMLQVVERDPVALRMLNSAVPKDLETICLKCLRKEPKKRYDSAASLAEDLSRWLNHEPIQARPVGRTEKLWLWCRRRPAIAGSIAAVLLISVIASFVVVVQRRANLREQVETAVNSMSTDYGILVLRGIKDLDEYPDEMVLTELQVQFEASDNTGKLPLAYALAHFGEVRVEFLLSQVEGTSPLEVDNFVDAFQNSEFGALTELNEAARTATDEQNWRHKARLALLALLLDDPSLAHDMCELRPDPIQRTWFIEECSTWHGDLSKLAKTVADSHDMPLRSAVALAAGSALEADITDAAKQAWKPILSNWIQNESDALTHSAADWTMRRWNLELPEIPPTSAPIDGMNWYVNSIGTTMIEIPAGSYVRSNGLRGSHAKDQAVTLTLPFLLADHEVSRLQFQKFIDDPECPDSEKPENWSIVDAEYNPSEYHPVNYVNPIDAVLFCNWLSRKEGLEECYIRDEPVAIPPGFIGPSSTSRFSEWHLLPGVFGYRLPTSAEWEFACRAGTRTTYSHGDNESLLQRYAVHHANHTERCGSRFPNGWGLFDMPGNLTELCHESFFTNLGEAILTDPAGTHLYGTRGGAFDQRAQYVLSSASANSLSAPGDGRFFRTGFRLARSLVASSE